MNRRPVAFVVGFLALATSGVGSVAYAAPMFEWTPSSLTQTIARGERKTITVTFKASQNASNVVVSVVPELQPCIQVSPSSFQTIQQGTTTTLNVTFSPAPSSKLGTYQGTIQLILEGTIARPLPVSIVVVAASELGYDVNNNRIWDDVEDFINRNYSNSPETVPAIRQFALAIQHALLKADDKAASSNNAVEINRGITCLEYRRPNDFVIVANQLRAVIINTIPRHQAWTLFEDQLAGTITEGWPTGKESAACRQ